VATAIRQNATPEFLLSQWKGDGWRSVRTSITRQIPGDAHGNPIVHLQVDGFEWVDVTFMGVGNVDDAVARLRTYIQAAGSDLYAYALLTRTDVDLLGVKLIRYRLVLVHSQVQLVGAAIVILAAAFAAIIFWQYVTVGHSVALTDLQNTFGGAVTSVGAAVGQAGGAITNAYWGWVVGLGAVAIGFSLISKDLGVKSPPAPRGPSGRIGVRTGGVSGSIGT
jgi:hypothetical protein